MTRDEKLDEKQKAGYQVKEAPLLKRILNKILGPIRFF